MKKFKEAYMEALLKQIKEAAIIYQKNFVGKIFLYIFSDNFIEIRFPKESFRHLMGVNSRLSASEFYIKALNRTLALADLQLDQSKVDLAYQKSLHFSCLNDILSQKCFILENVKTKTYSYSFGATESKFTICIDYQNKKHGNICLPYSLRNENCMKKSSNYYEVDFIFEKEYPSKNTKYAKLLYYNPDKDINDLDKEILSMINVEVKKEQDVQNE